MQWLTTVQKRKQLPKSMASDIIWLQDQGKHYGPDVQLFSYVEYIWLVRSGKLINQSTLFRYNCMIDTLRIMDWQDDYYLINGWKYGTKVSVLFTKNHSFIVYLLRPEGLPIPLRCTWLGVLTGYFLFSSKTDEKLRITR